MVHKLVIVLQDKSLHSKGITPLLHFRQLELLFRPEEQEFTALYEPLSKVVNVFPLTPVKIHPLLPMQFSLDLLQNSFASFNFLVTFSKINIFR